MQRLAFRVTAVVLLCGALLTAMPFALDAGQAGGLRLAIRAATLRGFTAYVLKTEEENANSLASSFLWVGSLPAAEQGRVYDNLKRGEVEIRPVWHGEGKISDVPGGMIHDWEGLVFIPGVKLNDVLAVLQDYDRQSIYYAPDVERSRLESRVGDHYRAYLRFRRHKIITVVLNTEHDITYFRDSPVRGHSRSSAVRIAQLENPGTDREIEKEPRDDDGFLWRMETWWRFEERDGGVYVQNEVVTLTRDIPVGLRWLIGPFVTSIPKETLRFTMEATRKAVLQQKTAVP